VKNSHILVASTLVLAVAAGGYAAFEIGMRRGASMAASGPGKTQHRAAGR